MANVFLSYDSKDRPTARLIEKGLTAKGHQIIWGVDELIAGRGWGELMPRRLAAADAVVALLTPNSESSPSVWCEIGAARALAIRPRPIALLPLVIGLNEAPAYANDILVLWQKNTPNQEIGELVHEVSRAIDAHMASILKEEVRSPTPKIFISHRHKDHDIARALTEMLSTAFELAPHDIRCTSVQPYRLPFGKNTGERLRDEIRDAKAVLGILSPDTAESSYVMFELGAAWAQRIYTCPLLSKGAGLTHIPGPINDLSPARLWMESDNHQLLRDLGAEVNLRPREHVQGLLSERVSSLVERAKATA